MPELGCCFERDKHEVSKETLIDFVEDYIEDYKDEPNKNIDFLKSVVEKIKTSLISSVSSSCNGGYLHDTDDSDFDNYASDESMLSNHGAKTITTCIKYSWNNKEMSCRREYCDGSVYYTINYYNKPNPYKNIKLLTDLHQGIEDHLLPGAIFLIYAADGDWTSLE